jgi:hypothetical protein
MSLPHLVTSWHTNKSSAHAAGGVLQTEVRIEKRIVKSGRAWLVDIPALIRRDRHCELEVSGRGRLCGQYGPAILIAIKNVDPLAGPIGHRGWQEEPVKRKPMLLATPARQ